MGDARLTRRRAVAMALAAVVHNTTFSQNGNFSQVPGFARHFAEQPRRSTPATDEERALLQRHRPRLWLPQGHAGPIDFYGDYIAQGTLVAGDGSVQARPVDRALLNRFKNDPAAVFAHEPGTPAPPRARVFGRVDVADVPVGANATRRFTFLTYHAVFRHSGLVAGLAAWKELPLRLIATLDDWHQLDHYTAASVVLNERAQAVALLLQQHNGLRTHVFGEEVQGERVLWPADGRIAVDVAVRSNELYAHRGGRQARRAVRFVDADALGYLIGLNEGSSTSSLDITEPAREADYELDFLPPDDAFYSFAGYLGERRALPGRDGPPGADYNTWPTLKPLGLQLIVGYWREGVAGDHERLLPLLRSADDASNAAKAQAAEFGATLKRLGY